ncbi:MAG: hypothetical protein DHS20C18_52140 [Saprospiraceae bacterium]|nr:MAG: hypothetical protein DHS20C18_52140 [Saprospiraceae bacterium]
MATKKVKSQNIYHRIDQLKDGVKILNNEALQVSNSLVEASLTTGSKWQKLMVKAIQKGTVLLGNQQDLVLTTLEGLKDQYVSGNKRVKTLLDLEKSPKTKTVKAKNQVAKAIEKPAKKVATKPAKKVVAKVAPKMVAKPAKKVTRASAKKVVTTAPKTTGDDLKKINGVGPKVETLFNQAGIRTFEQLAKADNKTLSAIFEKAGPRFKTINPESWKEKALLAVTGK